MEAENNTEKKKKASKIGWHNALLKACSILLNKKIEFELIRDC